MDSHNNLVNLQKKTELNMGERVYRSILNIKIGLLFYVISLALAFFSRKIFLDNLGAEFIGLVGMLMNILSFLSVAELGIGTSIIYFLYKPLRDNNYETINEIMSILAFLYRQIGLVILCAGVIISFFFSWWFRNITLGLPLVYFSYYSFLFSSISGYLFNYKQLLVAANQKQYIINTYFQSITIIQSIIQIVLVLFYKNLWMWIAVGFLCTYIGIIIFNHRINKLYPWLRINLRDGKKNLHKYPDIIKKTKQIFIHRIKNFILYRSDDILVGTFVSITQVAFYGNYTIITSKLNFLTNVLSDGMNAGVGNLIAEGNIKNTLKVFWELTAIRFFITGVIVFGLILFLQPFVSCWFGKIYILSDLVVYLIIFNIFIFLSRGVVENYLAAFGLYSDTWVSWVELSINLLITICLAPHYGIVGILLGKIISIFFIAFFWKPFFLFKKGFKMNVSVYWRGMAPYYTIFFVFLLIIILLSNYIIRPNTTLLFDLLVYCFLFYPPILIFYFGILYVLTKGMKYFVARSPKIYKLLQRLGNE